MKILIIATDYFNNSNGLCISTQRFVKEFKEKGNEVRIVTNNKNGESDYPLDVYKVPFFNKIIEREGYTFAKKDKNKLIEAINWCDIVHLEDPFPLCKYASKIAKKLKKPCTATFHLYPENMTYSANIKWLHIERVVMNYFRSAFKRAVLVQCPTSLVKDRLIKAKFKNRLVVVSNGIAEDSIQTKRLEKPIDIKAKFVILSIGRYSHEKNHMELLSAINKSKYKANIKLILAGKGPLEDKLKECANEYNIDATFSFYSQDELKEIRGYSDIYVHTATVEVEGMACMESFASGCVPIISKNKLSSTWAYSIGDNNIYNGGDIDDLAKKIDYWYENNDQLLEYRNKYYDLGKELIITKSADKMLAYFEEVVNSK